MTTSMPERLREEVAEAQTVEKSDAVSSLSSTTVGIGAAGERLEERRLVLVSLCEELAHKARLTVRDAEAWAGLRSFSDAKAAIDAYIATKVAPLAIWEIVDGHV